MKINNTSHIFNNLIKRLPLIAVIISSGYFIGLCICIYFSGYFRDEYVPATVEIPEIVTYGMWILLISSIVSIVAIITSTVTSSKKLKKACTIYWFVVMIITSLFFFYSYHMQKLYPITISNEVNDNLNIHFHKISLDELKTYMRSEKGGFIYIGRNDCMACNKFESNLKSIIKQDLEIPTYYTNSDRDGKRSDEMYTVLEKYKINEVPTLIFIKNKKVEKRFTLSDKDSLETYLNTKFFI